MLTPPHCSPKHTRTSTLTTQTHHTLQVSKVLQRVDAKDGNADGAVLRMDVLHTVAIW